jgi:hypothetical protein
MKRTRVGLINPIPEGNARKVVSISALFVSVCSQDGLKD